MFIFLLYFLLNMKLTFSTVVIQSAGVYEIQSDDIAMIFYLSIENTFDCKIEVSVCSLKCIEGDPYSETADHMYVIGGHMGTINGKGVKNVTLIYPNLYLRGRIGKCLISLHYRTEQSNEEIRREIVFDTDTLFSKDGDETSAKCNTCDLNTAEGCSPVDCVIKYSSIRSYFNKDLKICQSVPECPANSVYIPKSNICRKLHEPVCKSDLEMIEDGYIEKCHSVSDMVNYKCYHGSVCNDTGECICDDGWTSSTCREGAYHPTLNLYHMCNIEFNSWQRANRQKLIMTILVLVILAIAIAAKMLIAVCLLNWCCHFIRRRRSKSDIDEDFCESEACPYGYCDDEECVPEENLPRNRSSRTIKVSFSNIEAASSDVTVSEEDEKTESKSTDKTSRVSVSLCHCHEADKR